MQITSSTSIYPAAFPTKTDQTPSILSKICRAMSSIFKKSQQMNPEYEAAQKVKIVIIGSGPAGYTAGIYAGRAKMDPILFEGSLSETTIPGGQLMKTTEVENYPGVPEGYDGPTIMHNIRERALRFGAKMHEENVVAVDFSRYPYFVKGQEHNYKAEAVIVATGAKANRLDIPGTKDHELWNKGVSACATCDGALPMFRNRDIYVIGGGDSAVGEALFLTKFARKVFIVHRREALRASKYLQDKAKKHPKIEILWNSTITKVEGDEVVGKVVVKNLKTQQEQKKDAAGVFFAVGHTPNTAFLKGQLNLDNHGFIKTNGKTSKTNKKFVYAAGDVQDPTYRQASTAVGSGTMAAMDAEKDLEP